MLHDSFARPVESPLPAMVASLEQSTLAPFLALASRLLRLHFVQNARPLPGVPASPQTLDAVVEALAGAIGDFGGSDAECVRRAAPLLTLMPGECALALDVIDMALEAAAMPVDCEARRDARAWLQDKSAVYSARLCFEALGIDYEKARKLLVRKWLKAPGEGGTA